MNYIGKHHKIRKSDPNYSHLDGWVFYSLKTGYFSFFMNASARWIEENYKNL